MFRQKRKKEKDRKHKQFIFLLHDFQKYGEIVVDLPLLDCRPLLFVAILSENMRPIRFARVFLIPPHGPFRPLHRHAVDDYQRREQYLRGVDLFNVVRARRAFRATLRAVFSCFKGSPFSR